MKIYHGTHFSKLHKILDEGITPRGKKGKTNWENAPSHPSMVYLSTAYPFYFSHSTLNPESMNKGLVFEIDMQMLDREGLFPDEDFIWQALRHQQPDIELKEVRKTLFCYRQNWKLSLEHMGTVAHLGVIPINCITRYCVIDFKKQEEIGFSVLDPVISVLNYQIKGKFYRDLVSWIFGDRKMLPQIEEAKAFLKCCEKSELTEMEQKRVDFWTKASKNRDGIEVVEL